ncbi:MAG: hypothetical protein Ct9H300mP14_09030 [Gammaproteobacteria bacterium]|nr:MAG: hypothetical protein Ct9H300mP14_09030 [Gammaproteobacteria bacterium]
MPQLKPESKPFLAERCRKPFHLSATTRTRYCCDIYGDVSGSTKGWINDAERESLVLLCEALEILGDRYAIYGFSGMTRKRCELYRIKRIDETYGQEVKAVSPASNRRTTRAWA